MSDETKPEPPAQIFVWADGKWTNQYYSPAELTLYGPYVPAAALDDAKQLIDQMSEGLECLPGCDSIAHEELCPVVNPGGALANVKQRARDLFDAVERSRIEAVEARKEMDATIAAAGFLHHALGRVFNLGHNLDCVFCGLKDKAAQEALNEISAAIHKKGTDE